MKRKFAGFVWMTLLLVLALHSTSFAAKKTDAIPGDVIVVFKSSSEQNSKTTTTSKFDMKSEEMRVNQVASQSGARVSKIYTGLSQAAGRSFALLHSDTKSESELLEELRANPQVLGVSLNYKTYADVVPNDDKYSQLWGMAAASAEKVWDEGLTGADDVYVAVLDTGVDYTHEDLAANFETQGYSRNFSDSSISGDIKGHGSHVAGTIAAVGNNGKGVAGVNWKAKIISLKVLDDTGSGEFSWVVDALNYLCTFVDENPNLNLAAINLSLGGWIKVSPEDMISQNNSLWLAFKTFSDKNRAVICVSAGNDNHEVGKVGTGNYAGYYKYPASLRNISNMIVVAASDNNSTYSKASYSNYSTTYVDVSAPGSDVYSSIPGSSYGTKSGTSMSTPHVTGVAALLKSIIPTATPSQVKAAIKNGANTNYATSFTASGFLDAKKALQKLATATGKNLAPRILTTSLPGGTTSDSYDVTLTAQGASTIKWSKKSGTLPAGLKLTSAGRLYGKPTKVKSYNFTLLAKNSKGSTTKDFTVKVVPYTTSMNSVFTDGTLLKYYYDYVTVSGGVEPYTWKKVSGTLPKGLSVSYDGAYAYLTGTPSKVGTYEFTLRATDSNKVVVDKTFTVKVIPYTISINWSFSSATLGRYYSSNVYASNGVEPYTWKKVSGDIPVGLSLSYSGSTAYLTGTPAVPGTYNFTLRVTDTNKVTADKDFSVRVAQPSLYLYSTYKNGAPNSYYNDYVYVSGGTGPYTWKKVKGTLPTGLSLNPNGTYLYLNGTPSEEGTYTFTIRVTETATKAMADKAFTIKIAKPIITGTLSDGKLNVPYYGYLYADGGSSPFTWKVVKGKLPTGINLTYSSSSATLSGTPTKAGTFTFTVRATDANGVDTEDKEYTIEITKPEISWTFKNGTLKEDYADFVTVSGGTSPYTWEVTTGTVPTGTKLTFADNVAALWGKPTKTGTFTFKLKVTDYYGAAATQKFTVKITKASSSSNKSSNKNSSTSTGTTGNGNFSKGSPAKSTLPRTQVTVPEGPYDLSGNGETTVSVRAELRVVEEDVLESYEDKDSDMVKVQAGKPLRFVVGEWSKPVSGVMVHVDDKAAGSVKVSEKGNFTLPADVVQGDFKVGVKAKADDEVLESEELYIVAE